MSTKFDSTGWLIRDKGLHYLASSRGWFALEGVPRGSGTECPARVRGVLVDELTVVVESVATGEVPVDGAARRPDHVVDARAELHAASRLRLAATRWLADRGYVHVTLPHVWSRTEEYGAEEYTLGHPGLQGQDLRLLQSPELPLYRILSEGFEPCWTFGRCYRHEVVHDPDRDGDYLLEFEQLVLGASHTSLEEMLEVAQDLVTHLAAQVSVSMEHTDFRRMDGLASRRGTSPRLDDLLFFAVPASWPPRAREVLARRLLAVDARIHVLDGGGATRVGVEDLTTGPSSAGEVRLGVLPAPDDQGRVRRILDVAATMAGAADDVARLVALQWNPTWSMHPGLNWDGREQADSTLPVRSFTSARVAGVGGDTVIRDAELHLGGVEVVHVREYAGVDDLVGQAAAAGARAELDYLRGSEQVAPPGMVGVFVGWERIVAVLLGLSGVDRSLLFPRSGDGRLRVTSPSVAADGTAR